MYTGIRQKSDIPPPPISASVSDVELCTECEETAFKNTQYSKN